MSFQQEIVGATFFVRDLYVLSRPPPELPYRATRLRRNIHSLIHSFIHLLRMTSTN